MDPARQLEILARLPRDAHFHSRIGAPLRARGIEILQLNLGRRCNLACKHCHVQAGPERTESMSWGVMRLCLDVLRANDIGTLDITGGAPELNPHLPRLLERAAPLGRRLLLRTNLVVLLEPELTPLMQRFAHLGVELVASLPGSHATGVDRVRGRSVFSRAIEVLRRLNSLGYGRGDGGPKLHLMHNPAGAFLPAGQRALEQDYRRRLRADHGVTFDQLFVLNNCPVGRYLEYLVRSDNYDDYMRTLREALNEATVDSVMCRTTLSVGWDGRLYDCDFNQMLELALVDGPRHIRDFDLPQLARRLVATGNHCYSCTAGAGSSCQGALDE